MPAQLGEHSQKKVDIEGVRFGAMLFGSTNDTVCHRQLCVGHGTAPLLLMYAARISVRPGWHQPPHIRDLGAYQA